MNFRNRLQIASHATRIIHGMRTFCDEYRIWPRRPAIRPVVLLRHRNIRLTWCICHIRLRIRDCDNILFTSLHRWVPNESRFNLDSSDGRTSVYCHADERCSGQYFVQRLICCCSVMVFGGITSCCGPLVNIDWYLKGEILQQNVIYSFGLRDMPLHQ